MPLCCGESQSVELLSLEENNGKNNNHGGEGDGQRNDNGQINYGTNGEAGKVNPFLINNLDRLTGAPKDEADGLNRFEFATRLNRTKMGSTENLHFESLHQAARDGDPEQMRKILDDVTGDEDRIIRKVNCHDDDSLTPLHYAARYNHLEIVQLLVEKGADVNHIGEDGATPLHFAARYKRESRGRGSSLTPTSEYKKFSGASGDEGSADETEDDALADSVFVGDPVVRFLLEQGAEIDKMDDYGCTALHFTAMRGNTVACQELLAYDAPLDLRDKQGMTPLHLACAHDSSEVAKMLLRKGGDIRCVDFEDNTPLHVACANGSLRIAELILDKAREEEDGNEAVRTLITKRDRDGDTPLHLAVLNRHFSLVTLCIDNGANANVLKANWNTPLHLAAACGDEQIAELLLDSRAKVEARNQNRETPLHRAATYNHVKIMEYLLDRGAKIESRDDESFTPLLLAAYKGHVAAVELLLKRKASLLAKDKDDKTALFWAASENKFEVVEVLLKHLKKKKKKSDQQMMINEADRVGNTALHEAAYQGFIEVTTLLIQYGAAVDPKNEEEETPLHLAAKKGRLRTIKALIGQKPNLISDEDENSNTALHLSALEGHDQAVRILVENGADIEARNMQLWTPLDCAAAKGWTKTARVLLDADSPVDPTDRSKTTPLILASREGHNKMVALLLANGAAIGHCDSEGRNCLDMALENDHADVAETIVKHPDWRQAMYNERKTERGKNTPMRVLIRKFPDIALIVFNQCCTIGKGPASDPLSFEYSVTYNYEFLEDTYVDWSKDRDAISDYGFRVSGDDCYDENGYLKHDAKAYCDDEIILKKNTPLMIMVKSRREELLRHPLVSSLLSHKWRTIGRYVYYTNVLFFFLYVLLLTTYMFLSTPPYRFIKQCWNQTGHDPQEDSCIDLCKAMQNNCTDQEYVKEQLKFHENFGYVIAKIIMALSIFNLCREMFQMFVRRRSYLVFENLFELFAYLSTLLLVIDTNVCSGQTGFRCSWQWTLGSLSIFCVWLDLILFIRKFPTFGIYVVMFTDILKTFGKFFVVFFLFILSFAFAFHCFFRDQPAFDDGASSIMKTTVMMIGELEYENMFQQEDGNFNLDRIRYFSLFFYALFLIIMPIILMNLLVGLAVDDIKGVQEQAVLKRLAMQIEMSLEVFSLMPHWMRRRNVRRRITVYPNDSWTNKLRSCCGMRRSIRRSEEVDQALNPEKSDLDQLAEDQIKLSNCVKTLQEQFISLADQNSRIEQILVALAVERQVKIPTESRDLWGDTGNGYDEPGDRLPPPAMREENVGDGEV